MKSFEQKLKEFEIEQRKGNALKAYDLIHKSIMSGEILSLTFTCNKQYGEPDDDIIVDYCVELSDGKNISDLGAGSLEDAVTEIAQRLIKK